MTSQKPRSERTTRVLWIHTLLVVLLVVPALLGGCASGSTPKSVGAYAPLYSDDPMDILIFTRHLSEAKNHGAIPHYIANLCHEDPSVRMMSHMALIEILILHDMNLNSCYLYYAEEPVRQRGIEEWREWYEKVGKTLRPPSPEKKAVEAPPPGEQS